MNFIKRTSMNTRDWILVTIMSVIGSIVLLFIYRSESLPHIICGTMCTYIFTRVQKILWNTYTRAWIRIVVNLICAWLIMIIIVVFGMIITHDPFVNERIADKGWFMYIVLDKLVRGIFFGVFFASIAYLWTWFPLGLIWYALMKHIVKWNIDETDYMDHH